MLLWKRYDWSDCVKSFDQFHLKSWQLITPSNIETCKCVMFLQNIEYCCEKCYFFNECTFPRISSLQDERDILK